MPGREQSLSPNDQHTAAMRLDVVAPNQPDELPAESLTHTSTGVPDESKPGPNEAHEPFRFPRRTLIAAGVGAVATGAYWYARYMGGEYNRAETLVNNIVDEVLRGEPTKEELFRQAAACGELVVDLDHEQEIAGLMGKVLTLLWEIFGTSDNFGNGLDNAGGPSKQRNATASMAVESLSAFDLEDLAMALAAMVYAHPGAYGGDGNFPGFSVGAKDSIRGKGQIGHPDVQDAMRRDPSKQILQIGQAFDDFRLLYGVVVELKGKVADPKEAMSPQISINMARYVSVFLEALKAIAHEAGNNIVKIHDNVAVAGKDRAANAAQAKADNPDEEGNGLLYRLTIANWITWAYDIQRYFPMKRIDDGPVDPFLEDIIVDDPIGPRVLGRTMMDSHRLPFGFGAKIRMIAWAEMVKEHIRGMQESRANHPDLHMLINRLTMFANRLPGFYESITNPDEDTGTVLALGDGHPGHRKGKIRGAEHLAVLGMLPLIRTTKSGKKISVAERSALYVPDLIAQLHALAELAMRGDEVA